MAYSHSRLRKTLALVRITTGIAFFLLGAYKVSSVEFGRIDFPEFLDQAIHGGAVAWMRPVLEWVTRYGALRVAVALGFLEIAIGVALVLGLLVRPASLLGMVYSAGMFLATWDQVQVGPSLSQNAEHQFRNLFPFMVFLMIGIGHAGETWGVGSLYHHHRARRWEREEAASAVQEAPAEEEAKEPGSFEEFLEQEERALAARDDEWTPAQSRDGSES